mgnify:CR=1 FL=1
MTKHRLSRRATVTLWVLSFVIVTITAGWQRRTGPSYPLRGNLEVAAGEVGGHQRGAAAAGRVTELEQEGDQMRDVLVGASEQKDGPVQMDLFASAPDPVREELLGTQ